MPGMGTIYLIHFQRKLAHAQHYLGYVDEDLPRRLAQHQCGRGSRILAAVNAAGIPWWLARTWSGSRRFERQLKNGHNTPRLCPVCSGLEAMGRNNVPRPKRRKGKGNGR
jgi:predicted GIY-YIG superfamily endonuclease